MSQQPKLSFPFHHPACPLTALDKSGTPTPELHQLCTSHSAWLSLGGGVSSSEEGTGWEGYSTYLQRGRTLARPQTRPSSSQTSQLRDPCLPGLEQGVLTCGPRTCPLEELGKGLEDLSPCLGLAGFLFFPPPARPDFCIMDFVN